MLGYPDQADIIYFGTFDFFLAALGRNREYGECCSTQTAHKLVQQSKKQALRDYCLNVYSDVEYRA